MTSPSHREEQQLQARHLEEATELVLQRTAQRPVVGIILGSGLGGLAEELSGAEAIPFSEIPHLQSPTVPGHAGRLVLGALAGKPVAIMQGRLHYYEGYSMAEVALPVRLLHALGIGLLVVTNAAGGLNPHFRAGDLMLISDHINLPGIVGHNPLFGIAAGDLGPRFVSMSQAYHQGLLKLAWSVGDKLGLPVRSGVYVMVGGPSYETPAELRFLRGLGGDAVGMSTASEVIVAVQLGLPVLGISGITNLIPSSPTDHGVTHEQVLAQGRKIEPRLGALIKGVIAALPMEGTR